MMSNDFPTNSERFVNLWPSVECVIQCEISLVHTEILSESDCNPLKIVWKLQFSNNFWKLLLRFTRGFMVLVCL